MKALPLLVLLLICSGCQQAQVAQEVAAQPPGTPLPEKLSAAEDHARLLHRLDIDQLRRGADGDANSPYAANYDEALANKHMASLPDVLTLPDGTPITSAKTWRRQAQPALREIFNREFYGRVPEHLPPVHWRLAAVESDTLGEHRVLRKVLTGLVFHEQHSELNVTIDARLVTPQSASRPVPVVLALSFPPQLWERFRQQMPADRYEAVRAEAERWKHQVLEAGWGFVEYFPVSVQPDTGDELMRGIIGLGNDGQPRDPDDWGALRAWAWGASRVLDYLQTDRDVDAERVAIHGHSRYGKASLVALAFDERFAAGFISSSGEGGAKFWRRHYGEQIGNIASSSLYHWMAGNFLKYAGPLTENDLPADAHQLLALAAPRPVFIGAGTEGDQWVDPQGSFTVAREAGRVYELLDVEGIRYSGEGYPPVNTAVMEGNLAYRRHSGGHTPAPNWEAFIEFWGRYIGER